MSEPKVLSLDPRVFTALGITFGQQGYEPVLSERVVPVVALPLSATLEEPAKAYTAGLSAGAVVGQNAIARMHNPVASGIRANIDRIYLRCAAATVIRLILGLDTVVGGAGRGLPLLRTAGLGGALTSVSLFTVLNNAGFPGGTVGGDFGLVAGVQLELRFPEIELRPGTSLDLFNNTQNQAFDSVIVFSERALISS